MASHSTFCFRFVLHPLALAAAMASAHAQVAGTLPAVTVTGGNAAATADVTGFSDQPLATSPFSATVIGVLAQRMKTGLDVIQVDHRAGPTGGDVRGHRVGQGIGVVKACGHLQAGRCPHGRDILVQPMPRHLEIPERAHPDLGRLGVVWQLAPTFAPYAVNITGTNDFWSGQNVGDIPTAADNTLLDRLQNDDAFRAAFAASPTEALARLGVVADLTGPVCDPVQALASNIDSMAFIKDVLRHGKAVLALGAGQELLDMAGIAPTPDNQDSGVLLAESDNAASVAPAFIKAVAAHRHPARDNTAHRA